MVAWQKYGDLRKGGSMEYLLGKVLKKATRVLNVIGGAALTFMMLLTTADVLMRAGGRPIIGTYEIVALCLALVIGFTMPGVSLDRKHVYMEFLVDKLSPTRKAMLNTLTRLMAILLFVLIGYNLFTIANEFHISGEVSPTIQIPFYPVAYGVGVCCFIQCLVFVFHIVEIWRGRYE
jgi:TRAP-type C4-dicarboxylate transport system permease small subunit